jgi:hypothetical protein
MEKIDILIENHPISELPREFLFVGNIPTKIRKLLTWKMTGVWKSAFKTYVACPPTPTPIEKRNMYDLKSTYIYYCTIINS